MAKKLMKLTLLPFIFLFSSAFLMAPSFSSQEGLTDMTTLYDAQFMRAKALLEQFETNPLQDNGGELLIAATDELEQIDLEHIEHGDLFKAERQKWLQLSLQILSTIDRFYKPEGAPDFFLTVLPPAIDGVSYGAPIDPQMIKDPQLRAQYIQAIEENKKKQRDSQLQIKLQRLLGTDPNFDATGCYIEKLKRDISRYYAKYQTDKAEYDALIEQSALNPERKKELLGLV